MDNALGTNVSEGELLYDVRTGDVVEVLSPITPNANWLLVRLFGDSGTSVIGEDVLVYWERLDVDVMLAESPVMRALVKMILWRVAAAESLALEVAKLLGA
jgi:hypothetical protein